MKIIIGICGSIASYKCFDLSRELVKAGHEVKVILTKGALEFIKPETFKYLGVEDIYFPEDDFNISKLKKNQAVLHIELSKWADKIIIAPLSANTLSLMNLGLASDLLLSTILATNKPVLLFPAMNTQMWLNEATQESLKGISSRKNFQIFHPSEGELACGDIGVGKLPPIETIKIIVETFNFNLNSKKVLITAGATVSPLDPVRYITNPSSGKMGLEVSKVFLTHGYKVTLLAGHHYTKEIEQLESHPNFKLIRTPTTHDMRNAALTFFPESDLYISTAAIADIEFNPSLEKIKKEQMGDSLPFKKAPDILKEVLGLRRSHQKIVGFAAETETTAAIFTEKLQRKPVDLLVGNKVSSGLLNDKTLGFQSASGTYFFISHAQMSPPRELTKYQVGEEIHSWFEKE